MSSATIFHKGVCFLLNSVVIDILAKSTEKDKIVQLLMTNFTFTTSEIADAFQDSYRYALVAIAAGLIPPEQQRVFWKALFQSKLENEFLQCIEQDYLQDLAQLQGIRNETALQAFRKTAVEQCNALAKLTVFQADNVPFTKAELASFVTETGTFAITDLVLEQLPTPLDKGLIAFLKYNELLGNAILFFLHKKLGTDRRVTKTLEALQHEGLLLDVRQIKTLVTTTEADLNQAIAKKQFAKVAQLGQKLDGLQHIESVTQSHYARFLDFSRRFASWGALLNVPFEQVLSVMGKIQWKLNDIRKFNKNKNVAEKLVEILKYLLKKSDLSLQIKARDEFTQHSSTNLQLIEETLRLLKMIPPSSPQFTRLTIGVGTVVFSTGHLAKAEVLFVQAHQQARNDVEQALSAFNLFQIYVRQQTYDKALSYLTKAISLNPQAYALHDIHKYPIERLLGADGMGCIFLCQHRLKKNQKVVVKCFWKTHKGLLEQVFQESLRIAKIAGEFVPQPIDYGFYDLVRQERGFFVTEYIEGAIDGETWLKQFGKLEVKTGIDVGLQIAKFLQIVHEQSLLHLDFKPANILLLKQGSKVSVKIIDFCLAKVAPSLGQAIIAKLNHFDLSLFAQSMVFDSLDYAPPEQQGLTRYGQPSSKTDVFAFGKTLYRLLTGESPQTLHPKHLASTPDLFDLLCDCVDRMPEKRVDIMTLYSRLSTLSSPVSQETAEQKTLLLSSAYQPAEPKPIEKLIENPVPVILTPPRIVNKRKWWNQLEVSWKNLFKKAIAIDEEPSDIDLDKIFQLQTLDCSWNEISDLEPLRPLTQLQALVCSYNQISDLEPLSALSQLQRLDCASNNISDIEPLQALTQMQEIIINSNKINNIKYISRFIQLQILDCAYNKVSDLEPLRPLTQLQVLDCASNKVSDLEPLRPLTRLQKLDCASNQVSDLEPLRSLTHLQKLDCASNQLSNLEPLPSLTQLQELIYGENPISQTDVEAFQKAVPNCRVDKHFVG